MKNKELRKFMIGIGLVFIGFIIISNFTELKNPIIIEQKFQDPNFDVSNEKLIKVPIPAVFHAPISISGDAALAAFCSQGSGTSNDPYIIEGYEIDASTAHGIVIDHTDAYLIIRDCIIENGSFINDNYFFGIHLF
ncbi:MAG: hypothetical protein ACTSVK_01485, partial [Promethearchaeota archaeon]